MDADGGVAAAEEEEEGGEGEGAPEGGNGSAAGKEGGVTTEGKGLVGSDSLATESQPAVAADHTGATEGSRKVRGELHVLFRPLKSRKVREVNRECLTWTSRCSNSIRCP